LNLASIQIELCFVDSWNKFLCTFRRIDLQRRLAAIVAVDVVGYTVLIGRDEERTILALKAHIGVLEPMISFHSGRIVKFTGDGFLAEFGSVVDAVSCADAMQSQLAERNLDEGDDTRLDFRMGVHAGDIVIDGDDILGDGVNIAARLEGQAKPGGVAISARVYDDVVNKLDVSFEDSGLRNLKNIPQAVQVYSIAAKTAQRKSVVSIMPDKPSVAVLPFANMSPQGDDEYFADGITEDIITALAYVPWIFVIARNSSFSYKGLSIDVRRVGTELGVQYVLEGSVRRSGDRLRVTGQLVDAESGAHIWAERYDGVVEDIFDLQDQISEAVVAAIAPEIEHAEIYRAVRKNPESLDGYDMYLRGKDALQLVRINDAHEWFAKSLEREPTFAKAMAMKAWLGTAVHLYGYVNSDKSRDISLSLAQEAMQLEAKDPEVLAYAGYTIGFFEGNPLRGLYYLEQATKISPSFAWAWASSSMMSSFAGLSDQSLEHATMALRLNPRDPMAFRVHLAMTLAYIGKGDFACALERAEAGLALNPRIVSTLRLKIICLSELGHKAEANRQLEYYLSMAPNFRTDEFINSFRNLIGCAESVWRPLREYMINVGFPN
jgi:adenylate cyclase